MLLLFIFFILISAAAASIAFYASRRKTLPPIRPQETFDPPATFRSLFAPDEDELRDWQREQDEKELAERDAELRKNLLRRAEEADFNSLLEAKIGGAAGLYDEVFQILLRRDADRLADFVTRNSLTTNAELVELSAKKLKDNPTLDNLLKFVYLSAAAGSAEVFMSSIETTRQLWNEKRLNQISGEKLIEVLESHYWLLASDARVSGAGYLLKEKLASVRREITGK